MGVMSTKNVGILAHVKSQRSWWIYELNLKGKNFNDACLWMLCDWYLFPYLLKMAYLWKDNCVIRCHGAGLKLASGINHFGIGS